MRDSSPPPPPSWLLPLLVVVGWGLRAIPLLAHGARHPFHLDYDEGVYMAASTLLVQGVLPYRDFVLVHPPGMLYLLAPLAAAVPSPSEAMALARLAVTFLGALSIGMVYFLVKRWCGPWPALLAAAAYALYPEAVAGESSLFLEAPVNALCLGSALLLLEPSNSRRLEPSGLRACTAGVLCGAALTIKLSALPWLVGLLVAARATRRRPAHFALGALVAASLLLAPLALAAPGAFWTQVAWFQFVRPLDGDPALWRRFYDIFHFRHGGVALLALVCLGAGLSPRRSIPLRDNPLFLAAALAYALLVTGFVLAPTHWRNYNTSLALPEGLLAGIVLGTVLPSARPRPARCLVAAAVVVLLPCLLFSLEGWRERDAEQEARVQTVRDLASPADGVFAFEPAETLLLDRLPPHGDGAPVIVDAYAVMLLDCLAVSPPPRTAREALLSEASQPTLRARMARSAWVLTGRWPLSKPQVAWLSASFDRQGEGVWKRRAAKPR